MSEGKAPEKIRLRPGIEGERGTQGEVDLPREGSIAQSPRPEPTHSMRAQGVREVGRESEGEPISEEATACRKGRPDPVPRGVGVCSRGRRTRKGASESEGRWL